MPFITYQLQDGSFATTDAAAPPGYTAMWSVTPEQVVEIEAGADIRIVDGSLVLVPYVDSSTYIEETTPSEGGNQLGEPE